MMKLDKERLVRRTKAEILDEVETILESNDEAHRDARREQIRSVHNFLRGRTYEDEMEVLHDRIVELERHLQIAKDELRRLKGEPTTATDTRTIR